MLRPLRSSAIVRIAVETMVWSSAARNIPDMRPARMMTICRWVKDVGASCTTAPAFLPAGVAVVMRSPDREYVDQAAGRWLRLAGGPAFLLAIRPPPRRGAGEKHRG